MGNNTSSTSKPTTPNSGTDSPRAQHPRHVRNIIPHHTAHRSGAPPAADLTQVTGSRPKSLPSTAISSLSGSPHSNHSAMQSGHHQPTASVGSAGKQPTDTPATPNKSTPVKDEPSKPVDVPIVESSSLRSHHSGQATAHQALLEGSNLISNNSLTDMYLTRPPRLPLPIEEEVHTPGSPILAPDEGQIDESAVPEVELGEAVEGITRKSSALSATTVDEDDAEELRVDRSRSVVPTKLEWKRGGDKIYVTGTIFQWNRKQRLHPVEGKPGCFAATVYILPGTHHIRFLVDGIMQTSPDLPTTVDFGNNLVNYIEVSPEDALQGKKQAAAAAATKPKPDTDSEPPASRNSSATKDQPRTPKGKPVLPAKSYRAQVPQYLLDFDQVEESPAYKHAVAAIEKLPTPPSLPGFLGKPILNAATLMKDDNSVLNMPNHTVLNHLATSSIKNNVLAVSATTRYRDKYVTTIIHKPSTMDTA
ncbi:hypothetical protein NLU13_1745 [Sarocladium strictum]|uniref:Association with the SNF1 complex (ASC) domain-containing protein n=1 Tax=Sarocladium strictum TaxID=5046 RepID=A0AA39GT43_SARSR|nr:hypothetical protein NLU13_1745 [Sarocladium strictum]